MRTVTLGRSDVVVPPLALGAMYWGTTVPTAEAHDILDHAVACGANFIDTSNNYPFWTTGGLGDESELCLGQWLRSRGSAARGQIVLATKLGARPARPGADFGNILGLSRPTVLEQIHGSLKRLETDHVDVLYAHIDDRAVSLAETVGAMAEVVKQGLARTIACSNITADRLQEALQAAGDGPRYVAVQNRFTLLSPGPTADLHPQVLLDEDVQEVCAHEGLTMLGYSTLLEGAYTRPDRPLPEHYRRPGTPAALKVLDEVATETGLNAGQAVLAWMTHRTRSVLPVVGVSRTSQIDSAITAVTTPPSAEAIVSLERARSELS